MAGDWIKMRHDLSTDPAVIAIGARLGLDEYAVVGRLHRIWSWADAHTADGNAVGVTLSWLDRFIGVQGFAEMLCRVGWLEHHDDGMRFVNFDRHMGKSAKQRALTSQRVKRSRNAGGVTKALPEKRREEVIQDRPKRARRGVETPVPEDFAANDTHRRIAAELGVEVEREREAFVDHAKSRGRTLSDWDAGFRQWLRNAPRFSGGANGRGNRPESRAAAAGSKTAGAGHPAADPYAEDRERQRQQRAERAAKLAAAGGSGGAP